MTATLETSAAPSRVPALTATDILAAIHAAHPRTAIVHEILLDDPTPELNGIGVRPPPRRIDALMFATLVRTAIEIKITKADLARDTLAKAGPWMRVTHRFIYAVPAGMVDKPPHRNAGLWWIHPDGAVEVKVRATLNSTPEPLPQNVVQALAYRAMEQKSKRRPRRRTR